MCLSLNMYVIRIIVSHAIEQVASALPFFREPVIRDERSN